jgi:tRNA threonylcarbamoyladenosine biosynthesis protein TsaB
MKIIAIETSSGLGGVAILEINAKSAVLQKALALKRGLVHGKLLVPAMDKLIKQAGWQKDELELVAIDIGPGSYTGLRVGLAIAKTMSYALKARIIGVASLDALVMNVSRSDTHPVRSAECPRFRTTAGLAVSNASVSNGASQYICPIIDARWNQVYAAVYQKSADGFKRLTDYLAISPEDLVKLISRYKGDLLLLGDGLRAYGDVFRRLGARATVADERLWSPRAQNVAFLGYESYKAGIRNDPIKLLPLYLRPTGAEVNLKIKTGGIKG